MSTSGGGGSPDSICMYKHSSNSESNVQLTQELACTEIGHDWATAEASTSPARTLTPPRNPARILCVSSVVLDAGTISLLGVLEKTASLPGRLLVAAANTTFLTADGPSEDDSDDTPAAFKRCTASLTLGNSSSSLTSPALTDLASSAGVVSPRPRLLFKSCIVMLSKATSDIC